MKLESNKNNIKKFIFIIMFFIIFLSIISIPLTLAARKALSGCQQTYTTKPGDYMTKIWNKQSKSLGITWQEFVDSNKHITDINLIYAGDEICICPQGKTCVNKEKVEIKKEEEKRGKEIKLCEIENIDKCHLAEGGACFIEKGLLWRSHCTSCSNIKSCQDLEDDPAKCNDFYACTSLSNLDCFWNGKLCKDKALVIKKDIGTATLADGIADYFGADTTKTTHPVRMPREVVVNHQTLHLVWDEKLKKWDYKTVDGRHYSVYGGEHVYFQLTFTKDEEYFYEMAERTENLMTVPRYSFTYIPKGTEWLKEPACAKYVRAMFGYIFGTNKADKLGVFGNAWDYPKNIKRGGGEEIFNDKKDKTFDYNLLKPGDIIAMYYSMSDYRPYTSKTKELKKQGKSYNSPEINFTHVALYLGKTKGKHMIAHLYHGKVRVEDIKFFLRIYHPSRRKTYFLVRRVLRPNQKLLWGRSDEIVLSPGLEQLRANLITAIKKRKAKNPEAWADAILQNTKYKTPEYLSLTSAIINKECAFSKVQYLSVCAKTCGPMELNVQKARKLAKEVEGKDYTAAAMWLKLHSVEGGIKYGMMYLDKIIGIYNPDPGRIADQTIRFIAADYHGGEASSRNAAFQKQLSKLAGKELALDGDLLRYDKKLEPVSEKSETEETILSFLNDLRAEGKISSFTEEEVREALAKEKTKEFEQTWVYKAVKDEYRKNYGAPEFAVIPELMAGRLKIESSRHAEVVYNQYNTICSDLGCVA